MDRRGLLKPPFSFGLRALRLSQNENTMNMVFIGASNEVGQFESGITAQWFGAVPAVILGGVGTILVVTLWAWLFPPLRQASGLAERAGVAAR